MRQEFWCFLLKKNLKQNNTLTRKKEHLWEKNKKMAVIHLRINKNQQNCLLYFTLVSLFNASSDWLRKSRDRAKKTSSLPGNTYCVSPLQKSRNFFFKCMNKPIGAYDVNRDDQIINIFKMIWILLFLL